MPTPSAKVAAAPAANPGDRRSDRHAWRSAVIVGEA
jgi:hypothetical protein